MIAAYLVNFDNDQEVVVLQVDFVALADERGYLLDDAITTEHIVIA